MLRLSASFLLVFTIFSSSSSLCLACKCLPLPAEDAFCRTPFLALIKVKEISVNQTTSSRSYTFELLQDLTRGTGKNLTADESVPRVMTSPMHRYNCAVFLEPNETYLVGGIFHHQPPHGPFLFSCQSFVEKWPASAGEEESTRKLNGYIQKCQAFDQQHNTKENSGGQSN